MTSNNTPRFSKTGNPAPSAAQWAMLTVFKPENAPSGKAFRIRQLDGREALFTAEGLRSYLASATKAVLTVKYMPKADPQRPETHPMQLRNQSVNRILRPASTGLTTNNGNYATGGAEASVVFTLPTKGGKSFELGIDLPKLWSIYEGEFTPVWPIALDMPRTMLRSMKLERVPADAQVRLASNFLMRTEHEAQSDGHLVAGVLIPMWVNGDGRQISIKALKQGEDDQPVIGEVRTDAENVEWRLVNVALSPANSPVYSAAYVLNKAGYAIGRRLSETNRQWDGFITVSEVVSAISGLRLELPEIAEREGVIREFAPTPAAAAQIRARRKAAKAAGAEVADDVEVIEAEEVDDLPF